MFYAKNGYKEKQLSEKWEPFENGQKWPQCKGYSPCKILSLGQKIKLPNTCEKRFHKYIKVVLCKKRLEKNTSYSKNDSVSKIAKNGHNAKALAYAKYSVWVKK